MPPPVGGCLLLQGGAKPSFRSPRHRPPLCRKLLVKTIEHWELRSSDDGAYRQTLALAAVLSPMRLSSSDLSSSSFLLFWFKLTDQT